MADLAHNEYIIIWLGEMMKCCNNDWKYNLNKSLATINEAFYYKDNHFHGST